MHRPRKLRKPHPKIYRQKVGGRVASMSKSKGLSSNQTPARRPNKLTKPKAKAKAARKARRKR